MPLAIAEMTYRIKAQGPLTNVTTPHGTVQYWALSEGQLDGERIHARLTLPGSDWMRVGPDGYWRPDVRLGFVTDDGATILLRYTGLVEQNEAFVRAAREDTPTDFTTSYLRMALTFEADDARYAWLTQHLWIARGRLLGTGSMEYAVHRVE